MNTIIHHPTGNANVRAAVLGLSYAGLLNRFHTTIATFPGDILDLLSNCPQFSELRRRRFDPSLRSVTRRWPWLEMGRLLSLKAGLHTFIKHETGLFCMDAVYQNMDKHVATGLKRTYKNGTSGVYAYEDGALHSFREAKNLGLKCLYELPIGYWRSAQFFLDKEKEKWPEWIPTLTGLNDSTEKLARKDEELRLADKIFVASSFTAKTLQEFPETLAPIEVIPYGFPLVDRSKKYEEISRRPLKLLFVGGLSQRKGIANLFAAVNKIGRHVSLTVVGKKIVNNCQALDKELSKHLWIPTLHHQGVLKLMKEHDVLVFPSLFEGFGLVITEAMSQGTPVITTDRTVGPDLITHGQNGWLTEAGSTNSLILAIEELLYHPENVICAGKSAMETAMRRSWVAYGSELAKAVHKALYSN